MTSTVPHNNVNHQTHVSDNDIIHTIDPFLYSDDEDDHPSYTSTHTNTNQCTINFYYCDNSNTIETSTETFHPQTFFTDMNDNTPVNTFNITPSFSLSTKNIKNNENNVEIQSSSVNHITLPIIPNIIKHTQSLNNKSQSKTISNIPKISKITSKSVSYQPSFDTHDTTIDHTDEKFSVNIDRYGFPTTDVMDEKEHRKLIRKENERLNKWQEFSVSHVQGYNTIYTHIE